jgi:hypothetical protein
MEQAEKIKQFQKEKNEIRALTNENKKLLIDIYKKNGVKV